MPTPHGGASGRLGLVPLLLSLGWLLVAPTGTDLAATGEAGIARLGDDEYLRAVSEYVRGGVQDAVAQATRWQPGDVAAAARRVVMVDGRLIAGAALLHVDAVRRLDHESARGHRTAAYTAALRLIGKDGAAVDTTVRRGTALAVASMLHAELDFAGADVLLGHALKAWPKDADLLVARGSIAETMAGMAAARSRDLEEEYLVTASSAASRDYLRALALSPDHVEARVRLGRVQLRLGRAAVAAKTLEHARRLAPPGVLDYVATLLLGSAYEVLGRLAEAQQCYAAALEQFPGAQVPRLALAQLQHRAGQMASARLLVHEMASAARATDGDPWWGYDYGQLSSLEASVASLRQRIAP